MAERIDDAWLDGFVKRAGGVAGTVHRVHGELLELTAAYNIPEPVQNITRTIPRGKGMAGLAWERREPVQTCNLKEDRTGDVRPGAKAVAAQAAVAFPVAVAGSVVAVVGVAYADERELAPETLAELGALATSHLSLP